MIEYIFRLCVLFLDWLGGMVGLSYYEINVLIFGILWPLMIMLMKIIPIIVTTTIKHIVNKPKPNFSVIEFNLFFIAFASY